MIGVSYVIIFFFLTLPATSLLAKKTEEEKTIQYPSSVEDLSDRNYFIRLRQLIAYSKNTIDVAISTMAVSDIPNDPVATLLEDLILATKRGVRVRFFLNTFSGSTFESSIFLREDKLQTLRSHKIEIHFVHPRYRYMDQLVIFDREWVLDGGLPWTAAALNEALGSATLSYSMILADQKRVRLELLPLWDVQMAKEERRDGRLAVPFFLLKEMRHFPAMAKVDDGDSMKIYLAILRLFYLAHQDPLRVNFEELGHQIPAASTIDRGALIFQVVQSLRRLEKEYELITLVKEEAERSEIRLLLPENRAPLVGVPHAFFDEHYAKELSPEAIYTYLIILYRLQMSGESPVWLGSERNIEQDFPLTQENFRFGMRELKRQNLIETFPFRLSFGKGYEGEETLEARYLINPIPALSERLRTWNRMHEEFGRDEFLKARELADLLGEPEDPKVVSAYIEFLKKYPEEHVRSLTQHVAVLTPRSTPALLDYLSMLLHNETQANAQLATT